MNSTHEKRKKENQLNDAASPILFPGGRDVQEGECWDGIKQIGTFSYPSQCQLLCGPQSNSRAIQRFFWTGTIPVLAHPPAQLGLHCITVGCFRLLHPSPGGSWVVRPAVKSSSSKVKQAGLCYWLTCDLRQWRWPCQAFLHSTQKKGLRGTSLGGGENSMSAAGLVRDQEASNSALYYLRPWASSLTSLRLNFLICKTGAVRIESAPKAFTTMDGNARLTLALMPPGINKCLIALLAFSPTFFPLIAC